MVNLNLIEIGLILIIVINFLWLRFLFVRGVVSLAWHWLLSLAVIQTLVIGLHLATQDTPHTVLWWFFNVNFENNFGSTFSAILLLLTGIMALVNGFLLSRFNIRVSGVWVLWGAIYLFLSYDETYMWHEFVANWKIYFGVIGVILFAAALYAGQFLDRKNRNLYLLLVLGLGITAGGGLLLDDNLQNSFLLEEFLELMGITYVFIATCTYLQNQVGAQQRFVRPLLFGSSTIWVLVMVFVNFWPLPVIEAKYNAETASTEYLDGALRLLGYHFNDRVYHPGEWVEVSLYWQATQPLHENYAQSVRLLKPPTGDVVAQADVLLGPPTQPSTNVWPLNHIFRTRAYLETDQVLSAPASYWLSVNVWRAPWDSERNDNMLIVSQSSQPLLLPDTLVLQHVVFLPQITPPPTTNYNYRFANNIVLKGYELPSTISAGQATFRFWWKTEAQITQELTQFLHLQNVESGEYYTVDHPPFIDTLPTSAWPEGMQAIGEWNTALLPDLPDGEYRVFTGLYEQATGERIPISTEDTASAQVSDNRIYLGAIVVKTD